MVSSVHLFPALCSDLNSDYLFLLSDEFPILITSTCSAIRKMSSGKPIQNKMEHVYYMYYYESLLIMFDI